MNIIKCLFFIPFICSLAACSSSEPTLNGASEWDFDHQLQFSKTLISPNTYLLEVIPNKRIRFQKIAAFLLRKSYRICQGYGFKIEVLKGIESYDHKRSFPNMISERFQAKVECPAAK